jgi:hypothetical protein
VDNVSGSDLQSITTAENKTAVNDRIQEYAKLRRVLYQYRELRLLLEAIRQPNVEIPDENYQKYLTRLRKKVGRISYW